jgi:hypothetical protein
LPASYLCLVQNRVNASTDAGPLRDMDRRSFQSKDRWVSFQSNGKAGAFHVFRLAPPRAFPRNPLSSEMTILLSPAMGTRAP